MQRRRATHAGSWYTSSADALSESLRKWLEIARNSPSSRDHQSRHNALHAIIAPHAGYSYSGSAAAYAYCAIDPTKYNTVFVLGPSHHEHMPNQAGLTPAAALDTPLGRLGVDCDINAALLSKTDRFSGRRLYFTMSTDTDEAEHSIEMHLPYLRHVFGKDAEPGGRVKIVPVVVGALDERSDLALGEVFAEYLGDGTSLFVISTDFCHWGSRFGYMPMDMEGGEISEKIELLDRKGMKAIETCDRSIFVDYIARTHNTICGRYPINVLLSAVQRKDASSFNIRFVHYEQSSKCRHRSDTSVSYASAHVCTNDVE